MANPVLFGSSAFCGVVHILAMALLGCPPTLAATLIISILTSLWNHGELKQEHA